jgi:hypothetical protein
MNYPDGTNQPLCGPRPQVAAFQCIGGACAIAACVGGFFDVSGGYTDGCECGDEGATNVCGGGSTYLGSIGIGGSGASSGVIIPGYSDYYRVDFPGAGQPWGGTPTVSVGGSGILMDVTYDCGSGASCPDRGSPFGITQWQLVDNQAVPGPNQWSGGRGTTPPSTLYIRVYRSPPAGDCASAAYSITASR